jgi:polysaccharide biosynthesis transport protein
MLQRGSPPRPFDRESATASGEDDFITLDELVAVGRRYARVVASTTILALLGAVVYLFIAGPTYIARTQLLIEPQRAQGPWQDPATTEVAVDQGQVESQVEILRSQKISNDVIRKLRLSDDPEFSGPTQSDDDAERLRVANSAFAERLNVRRIGQSYVIDVSFRSNDPEKSAQIANAIADVYLAGSWRLDGRLDRFRRFNDPVEKDVVAIGNVRVITSATAPVGKSSPQTKLVLALAALLGGVFGVGGSMALHALDRSVRSPKQVKQSLEADCLGSLPSFGRRTTKANLYGFNQVAKAPFSRFSDALRGVKDSIDYMSLAKPVHCLGITSPLPQEGTSTIASNLAVLYSLSGARPLLIDANFRNPRLTQVICPNASSGLIEALAGQVAEMTLFDKNTKTAFLPLIGPERIASALDFLKSGNLKALLKTLQQTYAPIIIDLPSLSTAIDARAISSLLDGNVIVAEWGKTRMETLREAVNALEAAQASVLGVIINKSRG